MSTGLFGIEHSNRRPSDHWGKNCFNSSFPAATASYMMSNNIPAIYIKLDETDGQLKVVASEIPIQKVFNCGNCMPSNLYFAFESTFEPYQAYSFDPIDGIDLVIKDVDGNFLSPLEVKLTVLPDSTTYKKPESQWGSEMVVRSATTSYCAFGLYKLNNISRTRAPPATSAGGWYLIYPQRSDNTAPAYWGRRPCRPETP